MQNFTSLSNSTLTLLSRSRQPEARATRTAMLTVYISTPRSLLASPLIIDLVVLTELMTRIEYKTAENQEFTSFDPVLSILSYMLKAPLVAPGTPVVNALFKQHRYCFVCSCFSRIRFIERKIRVLYRSIKISHFSFFPSIRCITNILCACVGLPPDTDMLLEHKTKLPSGKKY